MQVQGINWFLLRKALINSPTISFLPWWTITLLRSRTYLWIYRCCICTHKFWIRIENRFFLAITLQLHDLSNQKAINTPKLDRVLRKISRPTPYSQSGSHLPFTTQVLDLHHGSVTFVGLSLKKGLWLLSSTRSSILACLFVSKGKAPCEHLLPWMPGIEIGGWEFWDESRDL